MRVKEGETENNLEEIKKKLSSSSSAQYFLHGPLLKRDEMVRHLIRCCLLKLLPIFLEICSLFVILLLLRR